MEVRWSPEAADDLESIIRYTQRDSAESLEESPQLLSTRCLSWRSGLAVLVRSKTIREFGTIETDALTPTPLVLNRRGSEWPGLKPRLQAEACSTKETYT
jgi:hypothetical protein